MTLAWRYLTGADFCAASVCPTPTPVQSSSELRNNIINFGVAAFMVFGMWYWALDVIVGNNSKNYN